MAAPELWLQARGNKTDGDIFTDMELYAKAKTDATNASERGVIDWLSDCVDAEALLKHWGLDPAVTLSSKGQLMGILPCVTPVVLVNSAWRGGSSLTVPRNN